MTKILIIGGDGFCGWPTSLHLSELGHDVTIVDNLSRRRIDVEMGAESLTPIASIEDRITAWKEVSGRTISFADIDIAKDIVSLTTISGTHNLLAVIAELGLDPHIVHLGTMGVYGYDGDGLEIPEGYLKVMVPATDSDAVFERDIHMTKSMDQLLFQFYAKNNALRVTDLHQGIVWGTQTDETRRDERLINRFDYDGDYGTVLNRFLMQAAVGHPLTVHGTGGQTRAFIHIKDTVQCLALAVASPPEKDGKVKILNQMTETHRVRDLAYLVAKVAGAEVSLVDNPRKEAAENDLRVSNKTFLDLGLKPTTLEQGLLTETVEIAKAYVHRVRLDSVACTSTWTNEQKPGVLESGTPVDLDGVATPSAKAA